MKAHATSLLWLLALAILALDFICVVNFKLCDNDLHHHLNVLKCNGNAVDYSINFVMMAGHLLVISVFCCTFGLVLGFIRLRWLAWIAGFAALTHTLYKIVSSAVDGVTPNFGMVFLGAFSIVLIVAFSGWLFGCALSAVSGVKSNLGMAFIVSFFLAMVVAVFALATGWIGRLSRWRKDPPHA